MKKRIFFCLLFLLIVSFIISETALRISNFSYTNPFFYDDIPFIQQEINSQARVYEFDLSLFWKFRPGYHKKEWDVKINSLGFRNEEFPIKKAENITRIIVLGDSCTAGHGLSLGQTYSKQLEALLNKKENKYEVINAGVPGYSSFQGLKYFRIIAKKYKPDAVIVFFGKNDRTKALYADKDLTRFKLLLFSVKRNLFSKLKVFQFLMSKEHTASWKMRVSSDDYKDNLKTIAKEAAQNSIKVLFIKPADRYMIQNAYRDDKYIPPDPYIDLFEVFKDYQNNTEEVFLDQDYSHFNTFGSKIIAQELSKYL